MAAHPRAAASDGVFFPDWRRRCASSALHRWRESGIAGIAEAAARAGYPGRADGTAAAPSRCIIHRIQRLKAARNKRRTTPSIHLDSFETPFGMLTAQATLDGRRPFAVSGAA